jgi:hypothetical protein
MQGELVLILLSERITVLMVRRLLVASNLVQTSSPRATLHVGKQAAGVQAAFVSNEVYQVNMLG